MIHNLSVTPSIVSTFINELRDISTQKDSMRFRINLERISQIMAFEVSKMLNYRDIEIETPLGICITKALDEKLVIASILRAAIPMHHGVLSFFDQAENAFISAYRKYHKSGEFEIRLESMSSPILDGKTLILCDPMIATGASIIATLEQMAQFGTPERVIILGIIASTEGIESIQSKLGNIPMIIGAIDDELTAKGYIVPGLGDAGDLAFGKKI